MNHNSLIIAADVSTARLFRTAHTSDVAQPLELIELGAITALDADDGATPDERSTPASGEGVSPRGTTGAEERLRRLARRVAERARAFSEHHVCNPIVVVASDAVRPTLLDELERALPSVYIRPVCGQMAGLTPQQILGRLQSHEAFAPTTYSSRAS